MKHPCLAPTIAAAASAAFTRAHAAGPAPRPDPNFIASPAALKARIQTQLRVTRPERKFFLLGRVIGPEWFAPAPAD